MLNCTVLEENNPGISSCRYYGDATTLHHSCKKDPMSIDSLPATCTSFFYDGLQVGCDKGFLKVQPVFADSIGNNMTTKKKKKNCNIKSKMYSTT